MKSRKNAVSKPKSGERVEIWNTFYKLAWEEVKSLCEITKGETISKEFNPDGGTLPPDEFHRLASLVLCALAIEARTNHLIAEMEENGKLTEKAAEAVRRLPTEHKWFLLPALAKTKKTIDPKRPPHQAIQQICSLRNDLMHVNYDKLINHLPSSEHTIKMFENFVTAMENMNVVLHRGHLRKERKKVLQIGQFECKSTKRPSISR